MGRHSAPDEPEVDSVEPAEDATVQLDAVNAGRHSRFDDHQAAAARSAGTDEAHTQRIAIISVDADPSPTDTDVLPRLLAAPADSEPAETEDTEHTEESEGTAETAEVPAAEPAKPARRESGTRSDLRMLRQNSAVRAQAIGAVIASFLIYTIVIVVLGRTDVYLPWLFVPIVVSGFLVGLVLDLAHRRSAKS